MAQKKQRNPATAYRIRNLKEQNKQGVKNSLPGKNENLAAKVIVIIFIIVVLIIFFILTF
jgi:hypothetical protein